MKKTQFQLAFDNLDPSGGHQNEDLETKIEFLPCLFQSNIDESHKAVYFDSIIKEADPKNFPKHKKDSK